jgi:hypothetical protein
VKVRWTKAVGATFVVTAVGCGLGLGGSSSDEREGGTSSAGNGEGLISSGSSGASTSSGGSGGNLLDQGLVDDGFARDSTTSDAGPSRRDSAVGDGDADATAPSEAGPSQGTMGCPPGSDAGLCGLSSNVCCTCPNCFAPYPTQCFPAVTGCVGIVFSGIYARLTCGDSTNCTAGSVCCAEFNAASALTGSSCQSACSTTGAVQLCTSSGECATGKTCQPLTSIAGFSGCQ